MENSKINIATKFALATAVISGMANFVNKFAVTALKDPILFTTLKNSLVAVFLIGVFLVAGRSKEIRSLTKKQWLRLFAVGVIGGALPFGLFFTGLMQTSAMSAALIHKTLFLWVALFAIPFLKERMVWQQWVGIIIVFAANFFIGGFNGFSFNVGELMILAATVLWAVENIIAKKALADISSVTVGAARMVIGSALLIGYVAVFGRGFAPIFTLTSAQWGWTIVTGILLAGYVITWYAALKRAPATYVATILVLATVVTNVLSAIFVTHAITGLILANALVSVAGVLLMILFARKTAEAVKTANANEKLSV